MIKKGKMPDGTGLVLWEDEGDGWIAAYPVAKKSRLDHGRLYPCEGKRFCITVSFKSFWDASRAFDTLICGACELDDYEEHFSKNHFNPLEYI